MNIIICCVPAIGVALLAGCAGPLDQRWDDPVYRTMVDRYSEYDSANAGLIEDTPSAPSFGIDQLDGLGVDDAIRLAIEHSPVLRSAGYRVDAASGRVLQAGLYPNPSISFGAEGLGADAGSGGETIYTVEQEIVLGGKLDRARDVAQSDRLSAQAEFVAQEYAVATDVSLAYFAAVAAQDRLDKREELSALSFQLLEAARAKVDAGSATAPDRLRAEVVYEQAQIELDSARLEADAARQALSSAIGIDEPIELPLISSVDQIPSLPTRDEVLASTLEKNSQVSLAKIAIVRAKQAHRLAKAESIPNLIASVGPRYSDIDDETTVDFGIGFEIPLFDRNQGEIQATLAERLSASSQLQSVQLELLASVSQAWAQYQSANLSAQRYQNQLLPKAEQTLNLTQQAYKSGKADYLRLLDAQQVVIESQISYIDTLEQLHASAAVLNELSQTQAPWRNPRDEDQHQVEVNQ